jgi:hypothetical protein
VRLLAALPELTAALRAQLHEAPGQGVATSLAVELWSTTTAACRCCSFLRPDGDLAAAGAAAAGLLASTAKLAEAVARSWPFPGAPAGAPPKTVKSTLITVLAGPASLLAQCSPPPGPAAADRVFAGQLAAVNGMRTICALPFSSLENEALVLQIAAWLVCDLLCGGPGASTWFRAREGLPRWKARWRG